MRKKIGLPGFARLFIVLILSVTCLPEASAQAPTQGAPVEEDYMRWYASLLGLFVALGGAGVWWLKTKKAGAVEQAKSSSLAMKNEKRLKDKSPSFERELERRRENKTPLDGKFQQETNDSKNADVQETQGKKLEDLQSLPLPVFGFNEIRESKPFDLLPLSNDPSLLSAVEQAHEQVDGDEELREVTIRILTAFKTRNSVESLAQMALGDPSPSLRSKVVNTLVDFDHESVFEPILLACADSSREVRAAAARGLSRLSFDRADAWARLSESSDENRVRQAARAAIDGGFVQPSFERIVHRDPKQAYESLVMLALLVGAKETAPIMNALKNHHDAKVRQALLHLLRLTKDQDSLAELRRLLDDQETPAAVKEDIGKTIEEISVVRS